ncbi:unnamed protein product [Laminaria digitata]
MFVCWCCGLAVRRWPRRKLLVKKNALCDCVLDHLEGFSLVSMALLYFLVGRATLIRPLFSPRPLIFAPYCGNGEPCFFTWPSFDKMVDIPHSIAPHYNKFPRK